MKANWFRWRMPTALLLVLVVLAGCGGPAGLLQGDSNESTNGGLIYTLSDQSLRAFHSNTGAKVWEVSKTKNDHTTPYKAFLVNQGIVYLAGDKLYAIDANTGKKLWQAAIGSGSFADISPIVVDSDYVYIVTNQIAYAFHAHDGSMQWRQELQTTYEGGGVSTKHQLLLQNGVLYTTSTNGTIHALRSKDGSLLWKLRIPDPTGSGITDSYLSADDFMLSNGTLYVQNYKAVIALDPMSGKQRWVKFYEHIYSIAIVKDTLYVHATEEATEATPTPPKVYAHNLSNGSLKWASTETYPLGLSIPRPLAQTVSQNGFIYVVGGPTSGDVTALSTSNGKAVWNTKSGEEIAWLQAEGDNFFAVQNDGTISLVNGQNGKVLWQKKIASSYYIRLITNQNVAYAIQSGGKFAAIDLQSGNILWRADAGPNILGDAPLLSLANDS